MPRQPDKRRHIGYLRNGSSSHVGGLFPKYTFSSLWAKNPRIAKEKASAKIDAIVALAMACVAAVEAFGMQRPSVPALPILFEGPSTWVHEEATCVWTRRPAKRR